MKIVTGAAGAVGIAITEVLAIDRGLTSSPVRSLDALREGHGSVCDERRLAPDSVDGWGGMAA